MCQREVIAIRAYRHLPIRQMARDQRTGAAAYSAEEFAAAVEEWLGRSYSNIPR